MPLRVFVAGATGVVGRALLPKLRQQGHHVTALLRTAGRAERAGCADEVVVGDVLDPGRLRQVLRQAAPDVVVAQLSAFRGDDYDDALARTSNLWAQGTQNLVGAAADAGVGRVIAGSMVAAYSPNGHDVLDEDSPLWTNAPGRWGALVRAVAEMEREVLERADIDGSVLRYGSLYGPHTWFTPGGMIHEQVRGSALPLVDDGVGLTSFTHVDDAAGAVVDVLSAGEAGVFNVVDNEPAECAEWLPAYARMIGGPAPVSLTLDQARAQLDWLTVHRLTEQRGATNFRIRETLGWRPAWPSWREGFATLFGLWPG